MTFCDQTLATRIKFPFRHTKSLLNHNQLEVHAYGLTLAKASLGYALLLDRVSQLNQATLLAGVKV
jgi:hypothetical protein